METGYMGAVCWRHSAGAEDVLCRAGWAGVGSRVTWDGSQPAFSRSVGFWGRATWLGERIVVDLPKANRPVRPLSGEAVAGTVAGAPLELLQQYWHDEIAKRCPDCLFGTAFEKPREFVPHEAQNPPQPSPELPLVASSASNDLSQASSSKPPLATSTKNLPFISYPASQVIDISHFKVHLRDSRFCFLSFFLPFFLPFFSFGLGNGCIRSLPLIKSRQQQISPQAHIHGQKRHLESRLAPNPPWRCASRRFPLPKIKSHTLAKKITGVGAVAPSVGCGSVASMPCMSLERLVLQVSGLLDIGPQPLIIII
ncbi:hypothetical protein DFH27DRAFT_379481 [Peziza echinospora]|nr:hypothetical protein DFH27DRAFT_379481 [Peziza echinospora]